MNVSAWTARPEHAAGTRTTRRPGCSRKHFGPAGLRRTSITACGGDLLKDVTSEAHISHARAQTSSSLLPLFFHFHHPLLIHHVHRKTVRVIKLKCDDSRKSYRATYGTNYKQLFVEPLTFLVKSAARSIVINTKSSI